MNIARDDLLESALLNNLMGVEERTPGSITDAWINEDRQI
jgi:hypothetical protein